MNIFLEKIKENSLAVAPVIAIVLILNFTIVGLSTPLIVGFLVGSVFVVLGLSFFLIGVDNSITALGTHTGTSVAKSNKLWIVIVAGLVLGFFTSIAEPGLMVLSEQIDLVTNGQISGMSILVFVSVGLAIMLVVGFLRIFYNISLRTILIIIYIGIGILGVFTSPEFFGIAFDASGATTGILAVPFILSLGLGISRLKKDSVGSEEDSFGLVAMASTGAIIAVMVLNMVSNITEFASDLGEVDVMSTNLFERFGELLPGILREGAISLAPLLVIFIFLQFVAFKLSKRAFRRIIVGFILSYIGLVLFFLGVNGGFMEVGLKLGYALSSLDNKVPVIIVAFLIGFVTMLAEPAVYVMTHQIENVTTGYVKRKAVLIPLCIGVGLAVALSAVRTLVPGIQLWHYVLPGYIISLALTFFVPKLFVGIAFDAGGVATGPLTATFTLAFAQGVADAFEGADVLIDGFGMITMVALFPIITLQILGVVFKIRASKAEKMKGVGQNES